MTKVVPTETNDSLSVTSDAAQGEANAGAISEPKKNRVEQLIQEERGNIGSTASLPAVENIPPREEKGIIGSTAPLPDGENIPRPLDRFLYPSGSDAATAAEVEEFASNVAGASSTVPEPGANKDEVDTGSLLNPSTTVITTSSECREGQQQQHSVNTINVNEKSNENEPGGIARVSPVPKVSEMNMGKYRGDGEGDGDGTSNRTFSLSHPNEDTSSLPNADSNNPISLASGEREESKDDSRASSLSNNTLDTEEYDEDEEFEPAGGVGAVFARRGTRRFVPRPSPDKGSNTLASEKRPSFRAPPAMSMGHPVGSLSAEFLERHERRVKEAAIRRESVSELLKLVMNHDPVSSGSPMPDIDVVFPDYHSDQNEGDWFV